jgi:hypothetical protein
MQSTEERKTNDLLSKRSHLELLTSVLPVPGVLSAFEPGLAAYMAMHIEAHIKQLARITKAARR